MASLRHKAERACRSDCRIESAQLSGQHRVAPVCEAIIAAALVVRGARFLNQPIAHHPIQRAVKCAGTHIDAAALRSSCVFHHLIAMLFTFRQGEKNGEDGRAERSSFYCVNSHEKSISVTDMQQAENVPGQEIKPRNVLSNVYASSPRWPVKKAQGTAEECEGDNQQRETCASEDGTDQQDLFERRPFASLSK